MNETPTYIKSLLMPRNGKERERRVWGIELNRIWLPFLTACNTTGELSLPPDALGAPLRLAYSADGAVKFSKTGRPIMRVAKPLSDTVRMIRDNFTANLLDFTGKVMEAEPDKYERQVKKAEKAGAPIVQRDSRELEAAVARQTAEAISQAGGKGEPERVAVPA